MRRRIVCLTAAGAQVAARLAPALDAEIWAAPGLAADVTFETGIGVAIATAWAECDQIIAIAAMGIVVRSLAKRLESKHHDPAVVVVDEAGRFVIPVVGAHHAGGDALAQEIAALLDAQPVLTGASAARQQIAVDQIGVPYGWMRGEGDWTAVAAAETVTVIQTEGSRLWWQGLDPNTCYQELTSLGAILGSRPQAVLWIGDTPPPALTMPVAAWHPRTLWLGLGCERHTPAELIEAALREVMQVHGLAFEAIAGIASLDLKQDEPAFLELAERYGWPLCCFDAATLAQHQPPNPSAIVAAEVGTPSVAEAAALEAAQTTALLVNKQIHKFAGQGACTIAITRSAHSYNPRPGHLALIGSGPGDLAQFTPAARHALSQADVVLGYQLYLDLLQPLARPGQVWLASQITQEVQRAEAAIALAQTGLRVAMVSSGDCGIYGMAGLVLERLNEPLAVDVYPGITALQAAAARVGAPLMHDFCAISLSDLLTPWPVIETRLQAAAAADFVIALYNPRSRTRLQGFETALAILRQHRPGTTPVAIAKSVYRPDESIQVLTLAEVQPEQVDMLTLVLIGNCSTTLKFGRLVTPRGYAQKTQDPAPAKSPLSLPEDGTKSDTLS